MSFVLVFPKKKHTRTHKKMGEIQECFVLALSLVWFAGATPELCRSFPNRKARKMKEASAP